jgi:hypothetical protein
MGDDREAVELVQAMLEIALGDCYAPTGKARTHRGGGLAVFGTVTIDSTDRPEGETNT